MTCDICGEAFPIYRCLGCERFICGNCVDDCRDGEKVDADVEA